MDGAGLGELGEVEKNPVGSEVALGIQWNYI
jgi:hypothetical protein